MPRLLTAALLLSVAAFTGCQSAEMKDSMLLGGDYEKEGRKLSRNGEHPQAAEAYRKAAAEYANSLAIAKDRESQVFISFFNTKMSIVLQGQAASTQPDKDPQGTWEQAIELYEQAAHYAQEAALLRLKRNALFGQAFCLRPDNNSEGSWEETGKIYARSAELAKEYENEEERGEALRWQAVCLLKGKTDAVTPEARKLLEQARKLGDTRAAELLSSDEGRYCSACGTAIPAEARFCPSCGRDQTVDAARRREREEPPPTRRMGPGQGPGGPGSG